MRNFERGGIGSPAEPEIEDELVAVAEFERGPDAPAAGALI
jgi:hypothetical protein